MRQKINGKDLTLPVIWCLITLMKYSIALFAAFLYVMAGALEVSSSDTRKPVPLRQGVFLVATPELRDPHFIHTVVLLVSYGKEGARGVIINRPAGIDLKEVFPYIEGVEEGIFPIYLGGPVERDTMAMLFTSDKSLEGALKVFDNLYFTYSRDLIIPMLQEQNPDEKIRVFAGFAGWFHGQLEREIKQGAWITVEADLATVFTEDPFRIWPSIFKIPEDLMVQTGVY